LATRGINDFYDGKPAQVNLKAPTQTPATTHQRPYYGQALQYNMVSQYIHGRLEPGQYCAFQENKQIDNLKSSSADYEEFFEEIDTRGEQRRLVFMGY
jgi:hypothetical protein